MRSPHSRFSLLPSVGMKSFKRRRKQYRTTTHLKWLLIHILKSIRYVVIMALLYLLLFSELKLVSLGVMGDIVSLGLWDG